MRARKREGVQRRTSAKCEAIVNILVVTAFLPLNCVIVTKNALA